MKLLEVEVCRSQLGITKLCGAFRHIECFVS